MPLQAVEQARLAEEARRAEEARVAAEVWPEDIILLIAMCFELYVSFE